MKLDRLLSLWGEKEGVGSLKLDDAGICRLLADDMCVISLEKSLDGEGFYLYATIGITTPETEKNLFLQSLEGNLFGKETGRASIGYDSETRSLILFKYLEESKTSFKSFCQKFEEFMEYLAYWTNKLENLLAGAK